MSVEKALKDLKGGKFVLIHDSCSRENEVDMVIAAEKVTPEAVARMRLDGGGLICIAISREIAANLGLPFIQDVYRNSKMKIFKALEAYDIPYDEKSSFSIPINHRKTFTGITDMDRALTIVEFAKLAKKPSATEFGKNFRTPGHVHTLISSGIEKRRGHTELSTTMMGLAGLTPVAAICEMMDSKTKKALSLYKARQYAHNKIILINTDDILSHLEVCG
ncbi:MAG: 3,4-dihydroxy-2-butanone-4-phosphate synthase [Candidatus Altiarchaeota archaeon]